MCDDDNVEIIPRDVLVGEVSEHGGDERCCSVIHVQARLALRESDWLIDCRGEGKDAGRLMGGGGYSTVGGTFE